MRHRPVTAVALFALVLTSCASNGPVLDTVAVTETVTVTAAPGPGNPTTPGTSAQPPTAPGTSSAAPVPTADVPLGTSPHILTVGEITIPPGEPGTVSVVLVGHVDPEQLSTSIPIVVRNLTNSTVYGIEVAAIARDDDGDLLAEGSAKMLAPAAVQPGEWAYGYVYFLTMPPADGNYEYSVTWSSSIGFMPRVNLEVTEVNLVEGIIGADLVGIVANTTAKTVDGPITVSVICFDEAGETITNAVEGMTDAIDVQAGATDSFTVNLFRTDCPVYAVSSSGWDR